MFRGRDLGNAGGVNRSVDVPPVAVDLDIIIGFAVLACEVAVAVAEAARIVGVEAFSNVLRE